MVGMAKIVVVSC